MVKRKIQFMNRIDEKGRFCGLEAHLIPGNHNVMQSDTHTFSYVHCRSLYASMGEKMALSQSNVEYTLKRYGEVRGIIRK